MIVVTERQKINRFSFCVILKWWQKCFWNTNFLSSMLRKQIPKSTKNNLHLSLGICVANPLASFLYIKQLNYRQPVYLLLPHPCTLNRPTTFHGHGLDSLVHDRLLYEIDRFLGLFGTCHRGIWSLGWPALFQRRITPKVLALCLLLLFYSFLWIKLRNRLRLLQHLFLRV